MVLGKRSSVVRRYGSVASLHRTPCQRMPRRPSAPESHRLEFGASSLTIPIHAVRNVWRCPDHVLAPEATSMGSVADGRGRGIEVKQTDRIAYCLSASEDRLRANPRYHHARWLADEFQGAMPRLAGTLEMSPQLRLAVRPLSTWPLKFSFPHTTLAICLGLEPLRSAVRHCGSLGGDPLRHFSPNGSPVCRSEMFAS